MCSQTALCAHTLSASQLGAAKAAIGYFCGAMRCKEERGTEKEVGPKLEGESGRALESRRKKEERGDVPFRASKEQKRMIRDDVIK